jgi:hypothetical protein
VPARTSAPTQVPFCNCNCNCPCASPLQSLLLSGWALAALGCARHPVTEDLAARLAPLLTPSAARQRPPLQPSQLAMGLWSVARLMEAGGSGGAGGRGGGAGPDAGGEEGGGGPGLACLQLFSASRAALLSALPSADGQVGRDEGHAAQRVTGHPHRSV